VSVAGQTGQSKWMKARNIALRVGDAADCMVEPACWLAAGVALVVLVYLLTAPPILLAHARQTGSGSFPGIYGPVLMLIESDFGGPMVWYFNDVWGADLVLIGGDEGPPWYVIVAYAVLGVAFLGAIALPFWKMCRRKQSL